MGGGSTTKILEESIPSFAALLLFYISFIMQVAYIKKEYHIMYLAGPPTPILEYLITA